MNTRELKLFGDTLFFDDQPIASVAHLPAGVRMLLATTIAGIDPEPLDLNGLKTDGVAVVLNDDGKIVGRHFEDGPKLPDGYETATVVTIEAVKEWLKAAYVAVE